MAMDDNTDVDLAIARVQLAIAESDIRNLKNARTDYSNRKNQSKAYKPNGVSSSKTSNFTYSNPVGNRKVDSFRAGERGDSMPNPRANEYRAGERGQGRIAPKKAAASKKDTSFNKAGLIPAITSGDAKKFRNTVNKKGILPALRGK